ncbi:MAG: GtrA family protein [Firmicutes bacterium]|nr:GtrA family protein [Bacillota bacterium]
MEIIKKFFNRETISYLIFGVLTTIVSYVTYFIFDRLFAGANINGFPVANGLSTLLSWICAVSFAYITNKFFVFNSGSFEKKLVLREIRDFLAARIFSLIFEMVWMLLFVDILYFYMTDISLLVKVSDITNIAYSDIYKMCAKIGANVFVVIMNYFFSKMIIFKKTEGVSESEEN